jgi:hypothetical protein
MIPHFPRQCNTFFKAAGRLLRLHHGLIDFNLLVELIDLFLFSWIVVFSPSISSIRRFRSDNIARLDHELDGSKIREEKRGRQDRRRYQDIPHRLCHDSILRFVLYGHNLVVSER